MQTIKFIPVNIVNTNNDIIQKFININHIQQIYQSGSNIILELTDYTSIIVPNQNIHIFMDRFK